MGDFKTLYSKFCTKHGVQKQNSVADASIIDGHLNLSDETLLTETCAIIGKVLETSDILTKVSVDNCLLDDTGLRSVLLGLGCNSSVTTLSLKGNAIKDASVLELAKMLKTNKYMSRLSLEWNNLGINIVSFTRFCEALQYNNTLTNLDLRSNQLGPDTALPIGKVLAKNTSLTAIDLSFNNIGTEGAKQILEGLRENRSLLKLTLHGNNISDEFLKEIASQLVHIEESVAQREKYISRAESLKHSLKLQEEQSSRHIRTLEKNLETANSSLTNVVRESQQKIHSLMEDLANKTMEVDTLNAKYEIKSCALQREQERNKDLDVKCRNLQNNLARLQETHDILKQETKEKESAQNQAHQNEKESLECALNKFEIQFQEMESRDQFSKSEVIRLKELVISLEAELKARKCEFEETLAVQKAEQKEAQRKLEKQQAAQLKREKAQFEEKENELRKAINQLDAQNEEQMKDIRSLRNELASEKESSQIQLNSLKQQLKSEQKSLIRGMNDKVREVERNREELEERLQNQISACATLTAINAKLESKIHSMATDISSLEANFESKDSEMKIAEHRIRNEVKSQLQELQELREERVATREKIVKMQDTHSTKMKELEEALKKLEEKVLLTKAEVNKKEKEILKMKESETRRVGLFHSAFLDFMQPSSN